MFFNLPFFLVLLFSVVTIQAYKATDIIFLACGSYTPINSNQRWEGDEHSNFVPSNITTTSFSSTPDHLDPSVPQIPYSTARIFNTSSFTYKFSVSQGPKYLRLHFYPATYSGLKPEQSFFNVSSNGYSLLNNFSAFLAVSFLSKSLVVKEFLINVDDKQILNVTFTPSPKSYAFINGIEINSMPNNLYNPSKDHNYTVIPTRTPVIPTTWQPAVKGSKKKTPYAVIIGGIAGALVLLFVSVFVVIRVRRAKHYGEFSDRSSYECYRLSLKEVKLATDDFNEDFVIGKGGFGKVYKGYMDKATTVVAIKRLDSSSRQGFQEFRTEIKLLSKLRHVQLVSLIGYCYDKREMILVYDYMAHGTLREHLYKTNKPPLSWRRRLNICIGVAKGLHYLHSGGKRAIIHGDVKSSNILLDGNWVAKLSDFGLSKLGHEEHVNTVVKGSLGYIDPEYCWTHQLTKKSDVYSFGVVLLEVLCARPVIVEGLKDEEVSLVEWGKTYYRKGTLQEIVDPKLSGEIAPECLRKFGDVASKCLHEEGGERSTMEEVVRLLEFALQLQDDADHKTDGP